MKRPQAEAEQGLPHDLSGHERVMTEFGIRGIQYSSLGSDFGVPGTRAKTTCRSRILAYISQNLV